MSKMDEIRPVVVQNIVDIAKFITWAKAHSLVKKSATSLEIESAEEVLCMFLEDQDSNKTKDYTYLVQDYNEDLEDAKLSVVVYPHTETKEFKVERATVLPLWAHFLQSHLISYKVITWGMVVQCAEFVQQALIANNADGAATDYTTLNGTTPFLE